MRSCDLLEFGAECPLECQYVWQHLEERLRQTHRAQLDAKRRLVPPFGRDGELEDLMPPGGKRALLQGIHWSSVELRGEMGSGGISTQSGGRRKGVMMPM